MTALQELLAKVDAGTVSHVGKKAKWPDFDFEGKGYGYKVNENMARACVSENMARAYNGSLDAAKALHEAVLHEWEWQIGSEDAYLETGDPGKEWTFRTASADNIDPARAWLIAIIKALIAQEATT